MIMMNSAEEFSNIDADVAAGSMIITLASDELELNGGN